jgi:Predicted integral membrane protein (DUF2269)
MHYGNFAYKLFFFLHILCVVVGFGSTFVWAALGARAGKLEPATSLEINRDILRLSKRLTTPFIYAAGVCGIILVILSNKVIKFSDAWISIAFALFIVGALIAGLLLAPTQRKMVAMQEELVSAGGPSPDRPSQVDEIDALAKRTAMIGGLLHLFFLAILIDMVWGSFHIGGF